MVVAVRTRVALAPLAIAAAMLLACEGTPDLEFDGDAAAGGVDATLPDGRPDAAKPGDAAVGDAPEDAGPVDSSKTVDANTCGLLPDAPTGAGCCGKSPCEGPACNHCHDCILADCGTSSLWCCANVNGSGKFMSAECSPDPTTCIP